MNTALSEVIKKLSSGFQVRRSIFNCGRASLLSYIAVTLNFQSHSFAENWTWSTTLGNFAGVIANSIEGGTLISNQMESPVDFGKFVLSPRGVRAVFVAKLDFSGKPVWGTQAEVEGRVAVHGISLDKIGNCWTCGSFDQSIDFEANPLGGPGTYVAKYNPAGKLLWARSVPGGYEPNRGSIAPDNSGNYYLAGRLQGETDFGKITLNWDGFFLGKFDDLGNAIWVVPAGENIWSSPGVHSIALDAVGNCYAVGAIYDASVEFGNVTLNNGKSGYRLFIAKFAGADGRVLWARQGSGSGISEAHGVAVDSSGNPFLIGYLSGGQRFGNISVSAASNQVLVCSYTSEGSCRWAKTIGTGTWAHGDKIGVAKSGEIIAVGHFDSALAIDSQLLNSGLSSSIFFAKLDQSGAVTEAVLPMPIIQGFVTSTAINLFGDLFLSSSDAGFAAFEKPGSGLLLGDTHYIHQQGLNATLFSRTDGNFSIEATEDFDHWTNVLSVQVLNQRGNLLDSSATNAARRYYRARMK